MSAESAAELDAARLAGIEERNAAVDRALASNDYAAAVTAALADPPAGTKDASIKDKNTDVVLKALVGTKESRVSAVVKTLDTEQLDTLMKYVYKGLSMREYQGEPTAWHGKLFKWHASTVKRAGVGCIVRALSRKTL